MNISLKLAVLRSSDWWIIFENYSESALDCGKYLDDSWGHLDSWKYLHDSWGHLDSGKYLHDSWSRLDSWKY